MTVRLLMVMTYGKLFHMESLLQELNFFTILTPGLHMTVRMSWGLGTKVLVCVMGI